MKNLVKNFEDLKPKVNDTPYERVLAIGDVHGNFKRLMSLWNKLNVTEKDLVIFLGDYVDRGAEVEETLLWIAEKGKQENIIFLRGNHDEMMLWSISSPDDEEGYLTWLVNGGTVTLMALDKLQKNNRSHKPILDFIYKTPYSYKMEIGGREYFFCHAGINVNVPLDEQNEEDLIWSREEFFEHYEGDAVIISGHSPVQFFFDESEGKPFRVPDRNILMVDTCVYAPEGCLSAVDILTGEFWQSED